MRRRVLVYFGLLSTPVVATFLMVSGGHPVWGSGTFPGWEALLSLGLALVFGILAALLGSRSFGITDGAEWLPGYPPRVRLSRREIRLEYRKFEMRGEWKDWKVRGYRLIDTGVEFQYLEGIISYLVTRKEANAIFGHPACPRWRVPEDVRRHCVIPWSPLAAGSKAGPA